MNSSSHPSDVDFGVGGSDLRKNFWLDELIAVVPKMPGALCAQADADVWFPDQGMSPRLAKSICARCPELVPCRDYGLSHSEVGIWGGLTEREREAARRTGKLPPEFDDSCPRFGGPHRCSRPSCVDDSRAWWAEIRRRYRKKKRAA